MGDMRFVRAYGRLAAAEDRVAALRAMPTEELVMALAATSVPRDPMLVNVIATELQNRMRRTSAAVESVAEGIIIVDASGALTHANPTALRLLGQSEDALLRATARSFRVLDAHGEPLAWERRPVRRALELGKTTEMRGVFLERSDGSRFSASVLAAPILGEGEVLGAVVAFRDVTLEARAEAALLLRTQILDALADAVVATDLEGRIVYWNAAATELYGWRAEEVLGRNIVDVTPTRSSRADADAIMAALRAGRRWSGVFPVQGRSGEAFDAHVTNAPVFDASGRLTAIVGVSRPVTPK